jgi:hypothetical protein
MDESEAVAFAALAGIRLARPVRHDPGQLLRISSLFWTTMKWRRLSSVLMMIGVRITMQHDRCMSGYTK